MTMLISVFGVAGRFAGDLLTTALGWASSLLFGRVPRSHQIFVVLMMAWSFVWVVALFALVLPSIASVLLSATPHPPFVDRAWLGFALLVVVIVSPLGVGLAGYLVPADGERPKGLAIVRELLRGYLLAPLISGLLFFLASVGIARKARSKRYGWADDHVAVVVKPGRYDEMVADVERALADRGVAVTVRDAPRVLTAPSWLLTRVAGENVRKLRPDRLVEFTGRNLRIGMYPSDIAISGKDRDRIRARAAILGSLPTERVHLTTSAEAQSIEGELARLARSKSAPGAAEARAAFEDIDEKLLRLAVPTDEWDVLYRLRLKVDRDLLARRADGDQPHDGKADGGVQPSLGPQHSARTRSPEVREPWGAAR
jgi:hypothetical protein